MSHAELDPAFLSDEVEDQLLLLEPSHAHRHAASLGPESDDVDDLDALLRQGGGLSNELSELVGNGFGSTLHEFDHDDAELDEQDRRHDNADETSHTHDDDAQHPETPRRPQRRSTSHPQTPPNGINGVDDDGARLSLAFELATAETPGRANGRDLMRDLGFDNDDDDDDVDEGPRNGDSPSRKHALDESRNERAVREAELGDDVSTSTSVPSTPRGGTIGRRSAPRSTHMSRASSASLAMFMETDHGHDGASNINAQALLAEASVELEESFKVTTTFLAHLRRHTTNDVAAEASANSSKSPVEQDEERWSDRQPVIEALAGSLLKTIHERTKTCESQLRELAEVERAFSRNDVAWQATLGELEELPWTSEEEDDDEDDALTAGAGDDDTTMILTIPSSSTIPASDSLLSIAFVTSSTGEPLSPSNSAPPTPSMSTRATRRSSASALALDELVTLRSVTASLASTLSTVHEMTQVNQAAAGDASRKLRALRAQATTLRDELSAWERAEDFVAEHEKQRASSADAARKVRVAERVREEMKEAERLLNEGWEKAQKMLTISVQ